MREIKFRAWDKKRKEFRYPPEIHDWDSEDFIFHKEYWSYSDFQQFTGLKDKNGVEIYEGDIVKTHYFGFDGNETDNEMVGKIEYRPDGMCFVITDKKQDITALDTSNFEEPCFEVIGNIYENKELFTNLREEER